MSKPRPGTEEKTARRYALAQGSLLPLTIVLADGDPRVTLVIRPAQPLASGNQ